MRIPAQALALSRVLLVVTAVAAAVVGCGDKKDKPVSQTAAKVNKEEITVHQINFVLQQQRGVKPEQTEAASAQILERLIDQELAVQQAAELKIDREPKVIQQIEAAKREFIARAYVEHIGDGATKPTTAEVQKYYETKPALFRDRRIFGLMEINIEAKPDQIKAIAVKLGEIKNINQFIEYLNTSSIRHAENRAVRTPEQLSPTSLEQLSKMKDGQAIMQPVPGGAQVIVLAESRPQPVTLEQATPAVEGLIVAERKRELVGSKLKQLRETAKIEYVGKFHAPASGAASGAAPDAAAPAAAITPPPPPVAAAASSAPGGLDASSISKGLGSK
jgi:EpsD family peptidyl-prolyl cis-trans isomerase